MMWDNTERERIIAQALSAYTQSEITIATQDLQQWVRDYPDDLGIVDTFEVLSHKQDFAEDCERRTAEPLGATMIGRAA